MPLTRPKSKMLTGTIQTANLSLSASDMPRGTPIQTKHAFHGINTTTTGSTFTSVIEAQFDSDLQPNSQVMIWASYSATRGTYNSNWGGRVTLFRDSTNLGTAFNLANNSTGSIMSQDNTAVPSDSISHLDSAPGTGRPTYKLMHADNPGGSMTVQIGGNRNNTTYGNTGTMLTIMEIKG